MSNNTANKSGILLGALFAALAGVSGLASCGSGSTSTPNNSPNAAPQPITVTLVATSDSIAYHANTSLSWTSTNSTSCVSTGGGGAKTEGNFTTGALDATTTFTVTCTGANSSIQGTGSKTITVAPSVITHFVDNAGAGNVTVSSVNYLNNGAYITISGTTNYNGTYAVANVDTVNHSSFTIPHSFVADDAGIWKPAGGMIAGCPNQGATGTINLSTIPSRFHGVAPFSVFFDATATAMTDTNDKTTRPFHDFEYRWNFGETTGPGVANWTYGSTKGSRNTATGPVAAHVFETPGLYTVVLSATDGKNTVTNSCWQIAVEHPDSVFDGNKTVCVSTSGTFTGCPSGASHVTTSSLNTALGNISSSVKRILFNRGETWTNTATATVSQAGPGLIGAYGTGAKPFIQSTGTNHGGINFSAADWRVMDLALDAIGTTGTSFIGVDAVAQITELRLDATNVGSSSYSTGNAIADQLTVQDCTSNGVNGGQGTINSWIYGEHFSYQGNHMDNTRPATGVRGGEHVLRFPKVIKGVISNNDLWNPPAGKCALILHSINEMSNEPVWNGTYTEQVVIADNYFKGNDGVPWPLGIASQVTAFDERLRNIIVERNYLTETSSTTLMHVDATVGLTVRNNIFNLGANVYGIGVGGVPSSPSPPNDLINIYNNTFYSTYTPGSDHVMAVDLAGSTTLTTTVRNNIVLAPKDSQAYMTVGTGHTLVSDHNLVSTAVAGIIVNATPTVPADFMLNALLSNPARDKGTTGTAVPVWSDFYGPNPPNGTPRAQNIIFDIGASEVP